MLDHNPGPKFSVAVAFALIAVLGFVFRWLRDRRSSGSHHLEPVVVQPGSLYAAQVVAQEYLLRRMIPRKSPPRIRLLPNSFEYYEPPGGPALWCAHPSQVTITYKPARMIGISVPTAQVQGPPGTQKVRGRITTNTRTPAGRFDVALEEEMARDLLAFLAHARWLGVRVISKKPLPTPEEAARKRLTLV